MTSGFLNWQEQAIKYLTWRSRLREAADARAVSFPYDLARRLFDLGTDPSTVVEYLAHDSLPSLERRVSKPFEQSIYAMTPLFITDAVEREMLVSSLWYVCVLGEDHQGTRIFDLDLLGSKVSMQMTSTDWTSSVAVFRGDDWAARTENLMNHNYRNFFGDYDKLVRDATLIKMLLLNDG